MADVVVTLEHFNTHIDALSRRLDRLGLLFSRFMEDTEATTRRISRELDAYAWIYDGVARLIQQRVLRTDFRRGRHHLYVVEG